MSRIMKLIGEKAHERDISISTYPVDENKIVVIGKLIDNRLNDYKLISGERKQAGEIHHLIIRLLIDTKGMIIDDVELQIITAPRKECHDVEMSLEKIIGLKITQGFSLKARQMLGGIKGCAHLLTLLIAMGPGAIQGLYSLRAQDSISPEKKDEKIRKEKLLKVLTDTCYVWRKDGPALTEIQNIIKKQLHEEK